ncbi:hypothetical protein HDU79_001800 [Rhizoclosmatium sp. JEL0117]|nr:hypothetical protein HDU79_001800 [Rhizoclosmatium sp. JEL0117]
MQVDASLSRPSVFESKGRLFKRLSKASGTDIQIQGSNENFGLVPAADAANFPGLTKIPITHQDSIKAQENQRKSSPKIELASNTDSFDSEKLGASLNPNSMVRRKSQEIRLNEFNLTKTVDRSSSTSGPQTSKAGKKAKGQTESITEAYNNRPSISIAASMSKLGSNIMVSASPLLAATSLEFIRKIERADSEGSSTSDVLCALFSGPECDTLNAIPGLNTTQNVQSVTQDILARLASLYSKLFGALAYLGYKVAIIFDDLQWCDSFSLELLSNLMQKCPAVLFVCVKRPLEEWKDSRTHIMRNIKKVHSTKRIELDSLDKPSVEAMIKHIVKFQLTSIASSLTDEIFNRSQGNPLVADVLIRVLNDDPNIAVIDGVLKRTGGNAASLPSGATAAVVAQFDKLKPAMKQILKYASISGMEFNIQELNDIIMKTDEPALYDLTPSGIADTIAMYDVYRFVKETENKDVYCFSHFMIQQGILSTMVPSKREEIHAVYADYFLKKIKRGSNKWEAIQSVIQHLFQVTGQEERKQITLYTAFLESAEMGMINEAFDFYEALQGFPKRLVLTKNAYEVIRERRLLAFIHLSKGDNTEAMKHCQEALNIAGYERSSNGFSILRRLVRMFEASKQVITCEDEQRRADISKVYAQKHFKMAFKKSHPGISDVRASVASRRASEGNKRDSIRFDLTQRTIDEIIQTILLMKQILAPSFELIELQGVALILGQSLFKEQELQVASYFVEFSCALQSIGLLKLSNQASLCCERILLEYNEAKGQNYVASESEDYAIASIHKNRGLLHWYQGSWSQAAEHFKTSQEILNSRGKGFLEAAYFARNVSAGLFSICGNLSQMKASIESDVKFHLSDDDKELSGEFQFRQAAAYAEANLVEDTERLYSQAIEIYTVNTEDSIRTLLCMTNAIRSALVILHNGLDHENVVSHQVERINNHFETCSESTLSVKPLQVSLLSRIWISQLILMMELHILTSGKLTARSEVSVTILNLMSEINKANTASLTKPLTEVSGFCKRLCGAVKALWSPVANVQAFSNETRKALKIGDTKPWLDSHLRRLLMSRILCVLTIHGSKEKHELPIDEYLFEQDGFLYEATLLREFANVK